MAGTTADRPEHAGHPERREPDDVRGAARRRVNFSPWNLLLLVPLVAIAVPAFYNKLDPSSATCRSSTGTSCVASRSVWC